MDDETRRPVDKETARRRDAFASAVHSLRIEGRTLDPDTVPEYARVIAGTMSFDDAAKSIVERLSRKRT